MALYQLSYGAQEASGTLSVRPVGVERAAACEGVDPRRRREGRRPASGPIGRRVARRDRTAARRVTDCRAAATPWPPCVICACVWSARPESNRCRNALQASALTAWRRAPVGEERAPPRSPRHGAGAVDLILRNRRRPPHHGGGSAQSGSVSPRRAGDAACGLLCRCQGAEYGNGHTWRAYTRQP